MSASVLITSVFVSTANCLLELVWLLGLATV